MGNHVSPAQTSFNAGELSPMWAGRVDMAKYGNGLFRSRNLLPLPPGPGRRRSGTRFAAEAKNSAHRSWAFRFIFSEEDSYVIEIGDRYMRFYAGDGQLLLSAVPTAWSNATAYVVGDLVSRLGVNYYCKVAHTNQVPPNATFWHPLTGSIYEIPSPYAIADLTNTDGTFRIDFEQTGDVIFMTHPGYFPKKLTRFANTFWTVADCAITGGPFVDQRADETITVYSSAETGSVTLTASSAIFTPPMIGTLFLLESKRRDDYAVWEVAKPIALNAERRSDSNVYKALNAGTTGTVKPTHREGARYDGDGAVQWEYQHSGYGIARITAIGGGGTTATATVLTPLPSQAVGVANASTRWATAAWRSDLGFPTACAIHRERLCFLRRQDVWGSVAGDFESFASRDGAETLPDSAFRTTIGSTETNAGVWMTSADSLLVGTRGAEFEIAEVTNTEVFGPGNIKAVLATEYGSRQVRPLRIGESTLYAQRSGRSIRDLRYSFNANGYESVDLMVLSDHVLQGQMIQMEFALEPHSIAWACCADGALVGLTYKLEQDVVAWHPHEIGGDGIVESVAVIPAPDGTHDRLWMQVRRTINGVTRRYFEYMERDWLATQQDLTTALFSDCAATFDGALPGATATIQNGITWQAGEAGQVTLNFVPIATDVNDHLIVRAPNGETARIRIDAATNPAPVTFVTAIPVSLRNVLSNNVRWARDVIGGLGYLEGKEVTILVDGAAHPPRTVTGGEIVLQSPSTLVQVGLRCDAEGVTMRIEGGSATGTAQGKMKRIHSCTFRVHETLGGKAGAEGFEDDFQYRSDGMPMDQPPPVFTGDLVMPYPDGYNTDARVRVVCDQPLPFTLVAIFPQLVVEDRT